MSCVTFCKREGFAMIMSTKVTRVTQRKQEGNSKKTQRKIKGIKRRSI